MDSAKVKPLGMYQTSENEFLLVYQWGACFVTKCMSPFTHLGLVADRQLERYQGMDCI
jgi:hypothetical protein